MGKKLTTKEFVKKARQIHGDKYDYSKIEYKGANNKVCIICPIHGEFWQKAITHLNGSGCIKCANKMHHTLDSFIKKAKEVHGDKYDYSKVEYINNKTKVCIICPEHGEFWQRPDKHLSRGSGCPKCGGTSKLKLSEFIEKANFLHKNKYDYSKVNYENYETKVCIICPIHGEFWQTPHAHLNGQGCPYCNGNLKLDKKQFIKKAKEVHGDKYDYSKVNYENYETKVCIICSKHGEFWQTPHAHLNGQGCPHCAVNHKLSNKDFLEKAKQIHGDRYDYSKVNYKNNETKVCIICPKHGEFWQTAHNHLQGQGCPYCSKSKLEIKISELLKENGIEFCHGKTFEWLKNNGHLYLDFYLPKQNIAIECHGEQHFDVVNFFGGLEEFIKRIKLDSLKYRLCNEHGIKILYYSLKKHDDYFSKVYTNFDDIKQIINE